MCARVRYRLRAKLFARIKKEAREKIPSTLQELQAQFAVEALLVVLHA